VPSKPLPEDNMTVPPSYATLLELSRQMLELAKRQDWELLTQTEAKRASALAGMPAKQSPLAPTESAAIAATIRQIQDCDREVLEYVTPWREHAATLLSRLEPSR
jgi:hypothetical protein